MAIAVDDVGLQARLQPDRLAAIDLASGRRWSYAALDRDIGAAASVLRGQGLQAGDRLAVFARNHVLLAVVHLACARLGAIYVPLNWRLSGVEIGAVIADCAPALLVHDDDDARGVRGLALNELERRIAVAEPLRTEAFDRSLPSLILYTSGTSGRPKGALLSEANLAETAINFSLLSRVDTDSRVLSDSPMFHIIGLITNVRPYWLRGGAVMISDGFDPARTLARIADPALAPTHYFCVPQMAAMLRQSPAFAPERLRGLTGIFTGGAPMHAADVCRWLDDGIALVNGYGMSEGGTLTGMPVGRDEIRKRPVSAGLATPRVELRIVDAQDRALPPGSAGELQVRGANLACGYWRRPEETARAFAADGWFRTGDIGVIDDAGFISVVDRTKDMFISGGENVCPAEVEAAVAAFEGIAECAVVGVPDQRWGEVGHLFVVPLGGGLDRAALMAHLAGRLARYKLPKEVTTLPALPRNGAGKVIKAELKALTLDRQDHAAV